MNSIEKRREETFAKIDTFVKRNSRPQTHEDWLKRMEESINLQCAHIKEILGCNVKRRQD